MQATFSVNNKWQDKLICMFKVIKVIVGFFNIHFLPQPPPLLLSSKNKILKRVHCNQIMTLISFTYTMKHTLITYSKSSIYNNPSKTSKWFYTGLVRIKTKQKLKNGLEPFFSQPPPPLKWSHIREFCI